MSKREKALAWALETAGNSAHGYDQQNRWGPDYDCSSFVITAWEQAGAGVKSAGATYTGNMRRVFLSRGFRDVTAVVDRPTGRGLEAGDVLLQEQYHTAMYIGGGRIVHAAGNERGGINGGTPGDQTGGEIGVQGYYNYPWDCVLRYEEETQTAVYTVQPGDSLWALAERWLGNGSRYREIMTANGLTSEVIHPGQYLLRPGSEEKKEFLLCLAELPLLRRGDQSSAVESMQLLLIANGYSLPDYGADGQWGQETETALHRFQAENGLAVGDCEETTWAELIGENTPA